MAKPCTPHPIPQAAQLFKHPVIQCFTLMMVIVFVVCNLMVDLLNAALDPRIRRHEGARS